MQGKAVVFDDKLEVSYREVEIPEPQSNEVVIDVKHSWVSVGTESSFLRGERVSGEKAYQKGDPWPFPMVMGYQKTGVIKEIGSEVQKFKPGDRVFATVSRVSRMFEDTGGHVNPAITPENQVWKLPEGSSMLSYSGMVLTQVGVNCGSRPTVKPNSIAVVIGDGLLGQWTAQTLLHRGAKVIVLGRHKKRLQLLPSEVYSINTKIDSQMTTLRKNAPNGISIIVDTVGDMNTFEKLQPLMERNSDFVSAGFLGDKGKVDIQKLREKEITLHTPSGWAEDRIAYTMKGIADGWLTTNPLITHRFPVHNAREAWDMILNKNEPFLGIVFDW